MRKYNIAIDAMGGDNAPEEMVYGAIQSARQIDVNVLLVGDLDQIKRHIADPIPDGIRLIPSYGVIAENEHPLEAFRTKPKASIITAAGLIKEGMADALVTMGSTGAAMAAGVMILGTMEGIERPALGGPFLGLAPKTTLVDLGTSMDNRPSQLLNYGVLGSVFATVFHGIDNPSVALLSVGAEEGKGNRQVREAYSLFSKSKLNFIGNVEGMDIPYSKADVVVCDGFVGNILMKFTEGLGSAMVDYLRTDTGGLNLSDEKLTDLTNLTNYVEYKGGGPLLGLNGVVIVGHGRSKADSVVAAVEMACVALEKNFVDMIKDNLAEIRSIVTEGEEN